MRYALGFMLLLAACGNSADKEAAAKDTKPKSAEAGAAEQGFGGGSLANGTANMDGGVPKNGQDPPTMTSGNAGHTF